MWYNDKYAQFDYATQAVDCSDFIFSEVEDKVT